MRMCGADLLFTFLNMGLAVAVAVIGGFTLGLLLHAVPRLRMWSRRC